MVRAWRFLVRGWTAVPLLGPLAYCTWANHKASIREFFITICFSTVTFWLTSLFMRAFNQYAGYTYLGILRSTVNTGQLFIFAVAFMGPIILTAADDPKNARAFPGRLWHILALVLLAIVSAAFYALQQSSKIAGLNALLDDEFLFHASVLFAVFAGILRYLATVYRKQSFDPEKEMKRSEGAFASRFSEHREEGA